jgi:hypothetical protein
LAGYVIVDAAKGRLTQFCDNRLPNCRFANLWQAICGEFSRKKVLVL